jgi:alpha-glucosidase
VQWWRGAVVYEAYVRSFGDGDGDGVGDLTGLRDRLGYLELLGVDAIRLSPVHPSPMIDHGYDVADPRDVDVQFGGLDAFDALLAAVHEHGMKLLVELVPNHTSSEHPWFRAALAAPPGSPARARYHFRPGRGGRPPTNWRSTFGGPAWTRAGGGAEWYLHLHAPEQPDLNWTNPEVWADLEKTLHFWLDRGVDGFRIAGAHSMSKPDELVDAPVEGPDPRVDDDGVHDVHRLVRAVLDHYPDRVVVGDVPVTDPERFARYLRPDELHLALGPGLAATPFVAEAVRAAIESGLATACTAPAWSLGGHDLERAASRLGGEAPARAMALVLFALPGAVFLYQGEELGLADADVPEDARLDPIVLLSRGTARGRDGHRVPLPWEAGPPGWGFTSGSPWLPIPPEYGQRTVAAQLEDPASTLSLYRQAIELRRHHPGFSGDGVEWFGAPRGCLAFRRSGSTLVCALNTSDAAVPLPPGDVLLSSDELDDGFLPPDTAAWLT